MPVTYNEKKRKVGLLLGLGILFIPSIFSWFLLRKGYSEIARITAFSWMVFTLIFFYQTPQKVSNETNHTAQTSQKEPSNQIIEKPKKLDLNKLRSDLLSDYKATISNANPHLNFIKAKYTKNKKGYSLWAVHAYFTQHSLDIGPDAKTISDWIDEHDDELKQARIIRVGLMSSEEFLGSAWFDIGSK